MSTDWTSYLDRFHRDRAGITEDVLARCSIDGADRGRSPYAWLVAGLSPSARVLDVGCGSAPTHPLVAGAWVGLDRSSGELQRAGAAGHRPLVRGDVVHLPIGSASVDVVTCSMALMLVDPLAGALAEIRRALRPGGQLRLLLPTPAPLSWRDRSRYLDLFLAARSPTRFPPSPLRRRPADALERAGFAVAVDERRRFTLPIDDPDDGRRFVDSWYLPGVSDERRARAAERAARSAPSSIGIPLRRVVAHVR